MKSLEGEPLQAGRQSNRNQFPSSLILNFTDQIVFRPIEGAAPHSSFPSPPDTEAPPSSHDSLPPQQPLAIHCDRTLGPPGPARRYFVTGFAQGAPHSASAALKPPPTCEPPARSHPIPLSRLNSHSSIGQHQNPSASGSDRRRRAAARAPHRSERSNVRPGPIRSLHPFQGILPSYPTFSTRSTTGWRGSSNLVSASSLACSMLDISANAAILRSPDATIPKIHTHTYIYIFEHSLHE